MNHYKSKQNEVQPNSAQSRRNLLDSTKLSRLPERKPFTLSDVPFPQKATVVVAVCAGCGARLDLEDALQIKFSGCRKCISVYGRLDAAREENAKRETRELLEKFAAGVKQ
jgi:ribosomal protein L40E